MSGVILETHISVSIQQSQCLLSDLQTVPVELRQVPPTMLSLFKVWILLRVSGLKEGGKREQPAKEEL